MLPAAAPETGHDRRRAAPSGAALLGRGLGGGRAGRRRLDRADDQVGIGRARDAVEFQIEPLTVAVGPGGADFEPGTLRSTFLLDDDRVNASSGD